MAGTKDGWDKLDIVAKALMPAVLAVLGFTYTNQQHAKDESQKAIDRIVSLGKSLSSENPREQQFAMAILRAEKKKHPNDVPDDLLAVAVPELLRIADTAPGADVASDAKQLALDLTASTGISDSVKKSVQQSPARIYFHIRDEGLRRQANEEAQRLQAKLGSDFVVPGIQRVTTGPTRTELRYFRQADKTEAELIGKALKDSGVGDVTLSYLPGYENSTGMRPRHFELWYGSARATE